MQYSSFYIKIYAMKKYLVLLLFLLIAIAKADYVQPKTDRPINWCGTADALEEYRLGKLPARPTLSGPVQYIERTNFRVHYTLQGTDAVTVAYAELTANAMQYSWTILIDSLGWTPPPPDFGQGGDDRYDIYLKTLSAGVAGVTYAEYSYSTPYPNGVCSHFRITTDLSYSYLKSTVCHEFHHAIQFRYSSVEGTWWMENCAVWSEEVVYEELNSYLWFLATTPNPLDSPHLQINTSTNYYWYAGGIWAMFLGEYYDIDCVRKIWTYQGQISGQNTLSGMDYVLTNQYGSSLATALKQYAVWRYFTGSRADTVHFYKEGNLFPLVRLTQTHYSYPASGNQSSYSLYNPGGAGYIQFQNGGGTFFINFNAASVYRWACFVVGYRPYNLSTVYELTLNSSAAGSDSLVWQDNEHFALIPVATQWEWSTGGLGFSYSANIRILHDVAVTRIIGMPTLVDSGAVAFPQAMIKNYGLSTENFLVRFTIGDYYTKTQNITLLAGDSNLLTFPACTLLTRNYNTYKCTTLLNTDERNNNNSMSDRVFVRVKDVATIAILEPQGSVIQGAFIYPQARIKNYGNLRENFTVVFTIRTFEINKATSLAAGGQLDLVFDSLWIPVDTGQYVVKCSTRLTNDAVQSNDKAVSVCYVYPPAVYEQESQPINVPYLSFGLTKIYLTKEINLNNTKVEIYNIQGKKVYQGTPELLNNIKLASGCYVLRLNSDNKTYHYKAVLIKK